VSSVDTPTSAISSAVTSVFGRTILFCVTCVAAITAGSWLHVGWLNPFTTIIVFWTIIVSFISVWGALFYFALFFIFIRFVRFEGSWLWLPIAFVVQAMDSYLMAGSG
jgi:hypothetical protein